MQPTRFQEAIPRGHETILLVEDETALRELTRSILEESGYRVIEAAGAEEALKTGVGADKIDLLLTDVVMPGGSELAKRMTSARPEIKVLFLSGYSDDIVAHHGALAHGAWLLQKPFTKRNLLLKIRELLDAEASVASKSKLMR